ncbi:hypothetical protein [Oricola indica]|uniref:hypothetical protein n=1 Tax=Oricola indica TaxID=2872591 RepID=UPI003CCB85C8
MGLIIRLAIAAMPALAPADTPERAYCIGSIEVLRIVRSEERVWPFADAVGVLVCYDRSGRPRVTYAPEGVFGAHAVISDNPLSQFMMLMRHRDYITQGLSPEDFASGMNWWGHVGRRLCERKRAATIRPCFK